MSINIQLDGKLQKISGQTMTKDKIVEKLGYTPANESTINTTITNLESTVDADIAAVNADLSDLKAALENYIKDHPDIVEDGSGEVVFTDEAGNIIAKLDADGFHTTNVEADSFISNDDNLIINDLDGNKIFQVDKAGVETTKLKLASGDVDDQLATHSATLAAHAGNTVSHVTAKEKETWNNKSDFSGNYSDLVGAPDIVEDESGAVVYVDEPGNIIFKIDSDGAHTTKLELASGDVDNQFADLRADLAAHTGDTKIHVTTEDKNRWNNKSDFSGDFNDLINSPFEEDNSGEINYVDESGNIIFKIDGDGAHTTELTLTGGKVDERINNLSANFAAHASKLTGSTDTDLVHITPAERVLWNTKVDAEYVKTEIANLVNSAPDALNTLDELAAALGDDENFATTVTNELAKKVNNDDFAEHEAAFAAHKADATHITANEREAWNNKSEFSGDYADLTNAPDITPEDNEDSLAITDSTGNIVFKAGQLDEDTAGIETVKVIITNDEVSIDVEEELNTKANAADVAAELEKKVNKATKINGKALSSDITIQPVDVHDKPAGLATGPHTKVTVDSYGHVISGSTPTDIANLGITNVYTKDEVDADIAGHENATNAHTKAQVGLSNVDNTSDADKPVSTATQTALDNLKTELSESITSESDSWTIVDEAGNIVLKAGELDDGTIGLETTTIKAKAADIDNIYDKLTVDAKVAALDEAKSDKGHTHAISAAAEDDNFIHLEGTSGTLGVSYKATHADPAANTETDKVYTKVSVDVKGHITSGSIPTTLAGYSISDAYTIEEVNAAVAAVSAEVDAHETNVQTALSELKTELSESITSESKAWQIVDNDGNVLLKAGELENEFIGLETTNIKSTTITAETAVIGNVYNKIEVNAAIAAVEGTINGLDFTTPTATDDSNNPVTFIDTVSQTNGKISATKKTIRTATNANTGIVKLSDAINGTETAATGKTAATPTAVKAAYDKAEEANAAAIAAAAAAAHSHPYLSNTTKYAGSSSAGGAATSANKVNKALTVQLNGGTTEDTNKFVFDGSAAKAVNITPAAIGAAEASLSTRVANNESDIAALKAGIAGGVHFIGTVSAKPTSSSISITKDGTTKTVTAIAGDVVIWTAEGIEYIYTGTSWEELGDITRLGDLETKVKNLKTTATNAVATTHKFVSQVTQSEGQVTVTYTRPDATDVSYNSADSVKDKLDDIDAAVAAAKVNVTDNLNSTSATDALSANQGRLLNEAIKSITTDLGNLGGGDMMKATYDKDNDGVVDNAEKLGGNDPGYYASKADLAATEAKIPTVNYPVTSVNDKTGAVTLTAADVNALPASTQIPSIAGLASTEEVNAAVAAVEEKLKGKADSTHTHDNYLDKNTYNTDKATFATKSELALVSQTATNAANKADSLESRLNGIVASGGEPNTINTIKVNGTALTVDSQKAVDITVPTQTSQLTNNSGFITSIPSEYVTETELANKGYLTAHQDISHLATTNYVDNEILAVDAKIPGVINNLTSTSTTAALSAAQGKALKDAVDAASTLANTANTNASTAAAAAANAQTTATEAKNAVAGIKIPTKVSELTNDSKYLTAVPSEYVTEDELAAALPDIKNDETNNLIIQDNAGNIITAIDATGITTTTVTVDSLIINGEIFSIITDEEIIEMFNEE